VPRASLESLYGLTRRESDVASALARRLSLRDAARELGITYETARSHLRRVFEKTGARRQTDLVRLLAPLAAHGTDGSSQ
ncbi:MAG: helix-turn-helix transcriptional regulator, partial [Vicinamibacterales bacterium]